MQMSFLEEEKCLALVRRLSPGVDDPSAGSTVDRMLAAHPQLLGVKTTPARISDIGFESGGWDVVFTAHKAFSTLTRTGKPGCSCGPCEHDECSDSSACKPGGDKEYGCKHRWHRLVEGKRSTSSDAHHEGCIFHNQSVAYRWWGNDYWWGDDRDVGNSEKKLYVELKPDMGDDFPAVLRQVKRYMRGVHESHSAVVVVVRRASFESVTWEQVVKMFQSDKIHLVMESELGPDVLAQIVGSEVVALPAAVAELASADELEGDASLLRRACEEMKASKDARWVAVAELLDRVTSASTESTETAEEIALRVASNYLF